jgi:hypothetical protein
MTLIGDDGVEISIDGIGKDWARETATVAWDLEERATNP